MKSDYLNQNYKNLKQISKVSGSGRVERAVTNPKKEFELQQASSKITKTESDQNKASPKSENKQQSLLKIFHWYEYYQKKSLIIHLKNQLQKRAKQNRYRQFIIEELISTEESYVNYLKLLIILKNLSVQYLNKQQCETIFMNVEQLHKLNDLFLKDLLCFRPYTSKKLLGPKLKDNAPFFKIYFSYYEGFNKSTIMLKQCKMDKTDFKKFVQEIESKKEFNNQDIDSLLIKPVQRLPKYVLLLEDLIKHTDHEHPDYQNLKESLNLFKKAGDDNNQNLNRFLSSKIFELEKLFGTYITIADSKRQYLTELLSTIFYEGKEFNVTVFFFNDLIVIGERQNNQGKPYQYIQSLLLDEQSSCLDLSDQLYIKNSFIIQGQDGKSITFVEQSKESKQEKMEQFAKLIDECKEKSKNKFERQASRCKQSEILNPLEINGQIRVSSVGVDERSENLSTYKVYIIEVGIGEVFQKIFLRYSQCVKIQDYIRKKFPKQQLNFLRQNTSINLLGDQQKEIEARMIAIPLFIQSILQSQIPIIDQQILLDLGLPQNFYELPKLITDEIRQSRNTSQKGPDRFSYISPQRSLIKTKDNNNNNSNNNEKQQQQQSMNSRRFSASQLLKKEISLVQEKKKNKNDKDAIQIIVYHNIPQLKPWEFTVYNYTKVLFVLEAVQKEAQFEEIYDFKLLIFDSKQRLKILENDENIMDLFGTSFIAEVFKKKELYFRKIIFLDLETEKTLLYSDNNRIKFLYYQLIKDISIASLNFTNLDQYVKIAAIYYYLQNQPLNYEIIQKIIPSSILKHKQKEYWLCVIQEEYKAFIDNIDNTQSTMIESVDKIEIQQFKQNGIFSSFTQKSSQTNQNWKNVNIDQNKAMLKLIFLCLENEFCCQQLFKVQCKEALTQFGEQNLILGVSVQGIKLYNSTKDRMWQKIDKLESFNVYPGSIEISYSNKKFKLETNQGFQIQSLFDEYQALKQQHQ